MSFFNKPGKTSTTTTTTRIATSSNKKAACFGINNYPDPSNRLAGCVNDANDWADYLRGKGFNTVTKIDQYVTSKNFKEIVGEYIASSKSGDYIVVTYSGHGSNVPDYNGDEADGRDECICLYDGFFIDDEIRKLFKMIHPEANFVFISDSCHSGTVTRTFNPSAIDINTSERLWPRFIQPKDIDGSSPVILNPKSKIFHPEANMNEILISGCSPTEYSYDARINGRNNGAMTAIALDVLKNNPPLTFNDFYAKLRKILPSSQYPQTPALEGSDANKNKIMFK